MRTFLIATIAASLGAFGSFAQADNPNNERTVSTEQIELAKGLPQTLVVRVKNGSSQPEVLHLRKSLAANESSKKLISASSFYKIDTRGEVGRGELDRDGSTSSWYFYCPYSYYYPSYSYYPSYYYYGYNYAYVPYYNYYYGGYNYWYYRWAWY